MSVVDTMYSIGSAVNWYRHAVQEHEPNTKDIRHTLASIRKAWRADLAETASRGNAKIMGAYGAIGTGMIGLAQAATQLPPEWVESSQRGVTAIGVAVLASGLVAACAKMYYDWRE